MRKPRAQMDPVANFAQPAQRAHLCLCENPQPHGANTLADQRPDETSPRPNVSIIAQTNSASCPRHSRVSLTPLGRQALSREGFAGSGHLRVDWLRAGIQAGRSLIAGALLFCMTGTNAESFSAPSFMTPFSLARRSRLIHLCNRFAFTPCESARLAIDTPGCKHASTSRLFACGSNIRLPSRFTLIIGSPSHTDSSMS